MVEFLRNLISSHRFGPHRSVKDGGFLLTCIVAALMCIAAFMMIEQQISDSSNGSRGANLEIFDKRYGYTPDEAHATLTAWGSRGRALYLTLEVIDFFLYPAAYRGIFLVLLNRMSDLIASRYIPLKSTSSLLTVIPLGIASLDLLENCGQVFVIVKSRLHNL